MGIRFWRAYLVSDAALNERAFEWLTHQNTTTGRPNTVRLWRAWCRWKISLILFQRYHPRRKRRRIGSTRGHILIWRSFNGTFIHRRNRTLGLNTVEKLNSWSLTEPNLINEREVTTFLLWLKSNRWRDRTTLSTLIHVKICYFCNQYRIRFSHIENETQSDPFLFNMKKYY